MDPADDRSSTLDSPEILSPGGISRYGRTRRPKITKDFYPIDKVFEDNFMAPKKASTPSQSQVKATKQRSPLKSPAIGQEIVSEFKSEEFTKFDDLGVKVANNFRTNLQRGLDDSIKERKFFKSAPENKPELDIVDAVDVSKVLKLISTNKAADTPQVYSYKKNTSLKTYSNRRRHAQDDNNLVVESFGLPDEPIISLNSPLTLNQRNDTIDIDLSFEANVNLESPWMFDDLQTGSLNLTDSCLAGDIFDDNFCMRNGNLVLPDNIFSEPECETVGSEIVNNNNKDLSELMLEKPKIELRGRTKSPLKVVKQKSPLKAVKEVVDKSSELEIVHIAEKFDNFGRNLKTSEENLEKVNNSAGAVKKAEGKSESPRKKVENSERKLKKGDDSSIEIVVQEERSKEITQRKVESSSRVLRNANVQAEKKPDSPQKKVENSERNLDISSECLSEIPPKKLKNFSRAVKKAEEKTNSPQKKFKNSETSLKKSDYCIPEIVVLEEVPQKKIATSSRVLKTAEKPESSQKKFGRNLKKGDGSSSEIFVQEEHLETPLKQIKKSSRVLKKSDVQTEEITESPVKKVKNSSARQSKKRAEDNDSKSESLADEETPETSSAGLKRTPAGEKTSSQKKARISRDFKKGADSSLGEESPQKKVNNSASERLKATTVQTDGTPLKKLRNSTRRTSQKEGRSSDVDIEATTSATKRRSNRFKVGESETEDAEETETRSRRSSTSKKLKKLQKSLEDEEAPVKITRSMARESQGENLDLSEISLSKFGKGRGRRKKISLSKSINENSEVEIAKFIMGDSGSETLITPEKKQVESKKEHSSSSKKRVLRSQPDQVDSGTFINTFTASPDEDDLSLQQRLLLSRKKSKSASSTPNLNLIQRTSKSVSPPKRNRNLVINPANFERNLLLCKSEVRVILNPLVLGDLKNLSFDRSENEGEMSVKRKRGRPRKSLPENIVDVGRERQILQNILKKRVDTTLRKKLKRKLQKIQSLQDDCQIRDIKTEVIAEPQVGDLTWAKIGTHPYWPCMVTQEPVSQTHRKSVVHRFLPFYHVRFFGDKGRRSWVSAQHLMPYHGKDDLHKMAAALANKTGKTHKYVQECYQVKRTRLQKWTEGVEEIDSLRTKTVQERLDYFFNMFASEREKRRKLLASPVIVKKEEPMEIDTPPVPSKKRPRTPTDVGDSPSRGSKKIKFRRSSQGNIVLSMGIKQETENDPVATPAEEFHDVRRVTRNSLLVKQEALNDENINNMNCTPVLKNRKHLMAPEYSNSDTDSKFSDNSSVPASLESQEALFRRNNIFRGVSKEKFCQICEKGGDVVKCKGACNGIYHYECAMFYENIKTQEKCDHDNNKTKKDDEIKNNSGSNVEIISVSSSVKKEPQQPLPAIVKSPSYKSLSLAEKIDYRMKEIMKNFDYQSVYADTTDSSSEECAPEEIIEFKHDTTLKKQHPSTTSKISLTVTKKPRKSEVPIIKHVTADATSYICMTSEPVSVNIGLNLKGREDLIPEPVAKNISKDFQCRWCSSGEYPNCLICHNLVSKVGSGFRQKCSLFKCGKYYHPECLKVWPQTQWSLINTLRDKSSDASYDTFVCPRHVCHTCISDDPRAANPRLRSDKVVKCVRCPATYHSSNYCVPAGTQILSVSQIICPRHYIEFKNGKKRPNKKRHYTINATWCFICSEGGNLICCDTCPTSVHVECLPGGLVESDTFYCEDCQSGRLPLYDEIVWVKLGSFRWWPALILFPNEVPENVKNVPHVKGEFVVKFFGTYDHYWVGRGRTFLFQEGDKGHSGTAKKRVDEAFVTAIEEAAAAHQLKKKFKTSKVAEKKTVMKPPPYIKIKVNKPVGNVRQFDGNISNTTSCECNANQPHPCGPDSDCLNRLLLTECNPEVCPAGERCKNQCFEKREYPPLTPHRTEGRGWGLKTLAPIRKGQFVIEYVGELIDEQEYQRRVQKMHEQKEENYYFLTIDNCRMLDAGPKGNVARFMNHCCQPNCETQKWTVNGDTRVGLFAKCDIPADTELTFNYNLECIGKEKKACKCNAPNCSGYIGVKVKTDESQKKSKKTKNRKKKVPLPVAPRVVNDNPCFQCGKTGDVGACNNKICTKSYHLHCVGLNNWPEGGKFVCAWHTCNLCSKRTIRCCVKCLNSYCPPHSDGNIRYDKLLGFVCFEHDPAKQVVDIIENVPSSGEIAVSEETVVTSTTSEVVTTKRQSEQLEKNIDQLEDGVKLNGFIITSTPLNTQEDENTVSSASSSRIIADTIGKKKRGRKRKTENKTKNHPENTANVLNKNNPVQIELKLSSSTPVRYLRGNRSDPERDLPIRKRTRVRRGHTL